MTKPFIIKKIRAFESRYKAKFEFQEALPDHNRDRCCYRCSISKDCNACKSLTTRSLCKYGTQGYFKLVNTEPIREDE